MAIPVLDLGHDAAMRGHVHGQELRGDIQHNIAVYLARFEKLGFNADAVMSESEKWITPLDSYDQEFTTEMRGVAEGSGCSLNEITMLNVRYEMIIDMFKRAGLEAVAGATDGCTAFAIMPEKSKSGDTLIGQNWDWIPGVKTMVARVSRDDKTNFICHGETGTVGGMQGVNEAGIGVVINALMSTEDGTHRYERPFRMRVRDVLNARNMNDALLALCATNRTVSMNFIVAHEDGEAMDVEAGPDRAGFMYPEDDVLTHSNHFCELDIDSEVTKVWPNSMYRNKRLEKLIRKGQQMDVQSIHDCMSDHFSHPHSICAHVDENEAETMHLETRNSIVIALKERKLWVTDGMPCENEYQEVSLAS
jgi:isopenicillin-N N-acyltransferase-like protein